MKLLCVLIAAFMAAVLTVAVAAGIWALTGLTAFCVWEYVARDIWTNLPYIQWWRFALGAWGVAVVRKIILG